MKLLPQAHQVFTPCVEQVAPRQEIMCLPLCCELCVLVLHQIYLARQYVTAHYQEGA